MQYEGWQHELTILVNSNDSIKRTGEIIELNIRLPTSRTLNSPNDFRLVLKKSWDVYDREIPFQIGKIKQEENEISFDLFIQLDILPYSQNRIGLLYNNATAQLEEKTSSLHISLQKTSTQAIQVSNSFYDITIGNAGELNKMTKKFLKGNFFYPYCFNDTSHNTVDLYLNTNGQKIKTNLVPDEAPFHLAQGPLVTDASFEFHLNAEEMPNSFNSVKGQTSFRFYDGKPYVLVETQIDFPSDTPVASLRLAQLEVNGDQTSHFTFRPSTPTLPNSEIEEMGHILVDQNYLRDIPCGNLFGNFMPSDIPWFSFMNNRVEEKFSVSSILLDENFNFQSNTNYQNATYLFKEKKESRIFLKAFRAPIHVAGKGAINVPAGSKYYIKYLLTFDDFDEKTWGQRIDDLGKRTNHPLSIEIHPRPKQKNQNPLNRFNLVGSKRTDYLKTGVR